MIIRTTSRNMIYIESFTRKRGVCPIFNTPYGIEVTGNLWNSGALDIVKINFLKQINIK